MEHIYRSEASDCEIRERIAAAGRLFNVLRNSFVRKAEVSKATKRMVYKTICLPTLTYSSESWTLPGKVRTMEMRFFRKIKGKTLRDGVRNTIVRNNLGLRPLNETLEESHFRSCGHLSRMPVDRIARLVIKAP